MKRFKVFDNATWWQAVIGCVLIAAPFVAILAKM